MNYLDSAFSSFSEALCFNSYNKNVMRQIHKQVQMKLIKHVSYNKSECQNQGIVDKLLNLLIIPFLSHANSNK